MDPLSVVIATYTTHYLRLSTMTKKFTCQKIFWSISFRIFVQRLLPDARKLVRAGTLVAGESCCGVCVWWCVCGVVCVYGAIKCLVSIWYCVDVHSFVCASGAGVVCDVCRSSRVWKSVFRAHWPLSLYWEQDNIADDTVTYKGNHSNTDLTTIRKGWWRHSWMVTCGMIWSFFCRLVCCV